VCGLQWRGEREIAGHKTLKRVCQHGVNVCVCQWLWLCLCLCLTLCLCLSLYVGVCKILLEVARLLKGLLLLVHRFQLTATDMFASPDRQPGNLGFDPLSLSTPANRAKYELAEVTHGRAAMMGTHLCVRVREERVHWDTMQASQYARYRGGDIMRGGDCDAQWTAMVPGAMFP